MEAHARGLLRVKTGSLPAHNSPYRLYIIIVVIFLYWINSHIVVFVCWFRVTAPTSSLDHTYCHTGEQSDQQNNEDYHSCKNTWQQSKKNVVFYTYYTCIVNGWQAL